LPISFKSSRNISIFCRGWRILLVIFN